MLLLSALASGLPGRASGASFPLPDLTQTAYPGELPRGKILCGPVAASNSLMWLAANGYPALAELELGREKAQLRMIRELASDGGMRTWKVGYTSAFRFLRGVDRYLVSRGVRRKRLKAQGWKFFQREFSTGVDRPEPDWIRRGVREGSTAWLLIVWYRRGKEPDLFESFAGHYVTVAGYGVDRQGRPAPDTLIIHDPSDRAGTAASKQFVKLRRLKKGRLRDWKRPVDAEGYYSVEGEMKIKEGAELGVIQAAFVLELEPAGRMDGPTGR